MSAGPGRLFAFHAALNLDPFELLAVLELRVRPFSTRLAHLLRSEARSGHFQLLTNDLIGVRARRLLLTCRRRIRLSLRSRGYTRSQSDGGNCTNQLQHR